MLDDIFRLVFEADTFDAEKTPEDYKIWCEDVDIVDRLDLERGSLSMSQTEMRWIVLDAVRRHVKDAVEDDDDLDQDIETHHLVAALSENGFCTAFEDDIRIVSRKVIKSWLSSPLNEVD